MANRNPHDSNELVEPPVFEIGQKVRSLQNVRNDGTYPGPAVGDVLIPEGAIGYVISIGSDLQMYLSAAYGRHQKRCRPGARRVDFKETVAPISEEGNHRTRAR